jgi:hypothetical protein
MREGTRSFGVALALVATLLLAIAPEARALPPPEPPRVVKSAEPTPAPAGATLPYGSMLMFVLDDKISSAATKPGTTIHMHLKSSLVLNGVTVAPAGAPATLEVVTTQPSAMGNIDGAVQIHLDPLILAGENRALPLRAYHEYVTIERTTGQMSTRDATDTIGDIFIPYHVLYHYLRSGRQLVLPAGSVVPARTEATIDASDPKDIVLSTPPPFESTYDPPHSDLTAPPLYTPAPERPHPLAHGRPTLPPKPSASSEASPAATASGIVPAGQASASPAAGTASSAPAVEATGMLPPGPASPNTPQP